MSSPTCSLPPSSPPHSRLPIPPHSPRPRAPRPRHSPEWHRRWTLPLPTAHPVPALPGHATRLSGTGVARRPFPNAQPPPAHPGHATRLPAERPSPASPAYFPFFPLFPLRAAFGPPSPERVATQKSKYFPYHFSLPPWHTCPWIARLSHPRCCRCRSHRLLLPASKLPRGRLSWNSCKFRIRLYISIGISKDHAPTIDETYCQDKIA